MATTNQRNRSGGQKSSHAGENKVQKTAARAAEKLTDMRDEMSGYVAQGTEQFGRMTRGHEAQAVMIALAAGFGVGFVIGCSLVSANRRPKSWSDRLMAEGLGRKLMARVEQMMPESIAEHLHR